MKRADKGFTLVEIMIVVAIIGILASIAFSNIQNFENSSRRFASALLNKTKVAVVPGIEFGNYGEGFVRFSYATKYELIEKALERIEKFLRKFEV